MDYIIVSLIFIAFVLACWQLAKIKIGVTIFVEKNDHRSTIKETQEIDDISWEQLGERPMYADSSDQGAVDVALRLRDLQEREAEEFDTQKKSALATKMKVECKQLVELTLLSVAPPPPPFSAELALDDNVVSFSDFTHTEK